MSIRIQARPTVPHAFSLIEVVLALGVIGFSLVAILGVFPVGFASSRTSISDTRAAQIANAITATIDAQCSTFSTVQCYGAPLDLTSAQSPVQLYVTYPSPALPAISATPSSDWFYRVELRFDNDPAVGGGVHLGTGKLNRVQIRIFGRSTSEGAVELFFMARNKG